MNTSGWVAAGLCECVFGTKVLLVMFVYENSSIHNQNVNGIRILCGMGLSLII